MPMLSQTGHRERDRSRQRISKKAQTHQDHRVLPEQLRADEILRMTKRCEISLSFVESEREQIEDEEDGETDPGVKHGSPQTVTLPTVALEHPEQAGGLRQSSTQHGVPHARTRKLFSS